MLKRFKISSNHLLFYLSIPSLQIHLQKSHKLHSNLESSRLHSKTPLHDSTTPFSTCRPWGFVKSQFDNYGY